MSERTYRISTTIEGTIVGTRRIQDHGRIQIPKEVREALGLRDGDGAYWIRGPEGRFYIVKAAPIEGRISE